MVKYQQAVIPTIQKNAICEKPITLFEKLVLFFMTFIGMFMGSN